MDRLDEIKARLAARGKGRPDVSPDPVASAMRFVSSANDDDLTWAVGEIDRLREADAFARAARDGR